MSTVRKFVSSTSIWHELTPALERVTRWCNSHSEWFGPPVQRLSPPATAGLIAETAFRLATLGDVEIDQADVDRASLEAAQFLGRSGERVAEVAMQEVERLRTNLLRIFGGVDFGDFEFFPPIPGVGVIDASIADARRNSTLYEVKTVTRGWNSTDLRQCFTYAAMLYASGDHLDTFTLVNPRSGRFVELALSEASLGAGASSVPDLLGDIAYRMTSLEVSA